MSKTASKSEEQNNKIYNAYFISLSFHLVFFVIPDQQKGATKKKVFIVVLWQFSLHNHTYEHSETRLEKSV